MVSENRLEISWSVRSATKMVRVTDLATGKQAVGRDWSSWEAALQRALGALRAART